MPIVIEQNENNIKQDNKNGHTDDEVPGSVSTSSPLITAVKKELSSSSSYAKELILEY